jgi:DNA-binding MarR family transcriptional regulator
MNTNMEILERNSEVVKNIAVKIFRVQPMLRKRIQKFEGMAVEQQMPFSHVQVLYVLNEEGSMTVSDISKRFNIAKPNITPLVDRLVSEGLVERQRSTVDRRVVFINILEAGRERLNMTQMAILNMIEGWADKISETEFVELSGALDSIMRILSKV